MEKVERGIPETVVLNSGHKMPVVGLGCAAHPFDQLVSTFNDAMEIGYRQFDTAACYGTEEAFGKAVAKALEIGLIKSRDELLSLVNVIDADSFAQFSMISTAIDSYLLVSKLKHGSN
ncbi:unnamed protein product [Coffea canephora]|uniref:NADP-dependent oxidoreductase domain-containing protein n=1 Tax=Coffea canephora TaxID=49390 RepID=A0A068VIP9_COFCA|nr:unnamed protein product [Coffea canephora]